MSQLMAEFFTDLAGIDKSLLWTTKTLSDRTSSEIAKQNALAIANRVGMKPGTQLSGVDLRGPDPRPVLTCAVPTFPVRTSLA